MIAQSAIQANVAIGLLPLGWQIMPASHGLKSKCPCRALPFLCSWYNTKNEREQKELKYGKAKEKKEEKQSAYGSAGGSASGTCGWCGWCDYRLY
ncbi:hypothetical protein [Blautia sp.]|uniref:hypothetical protein n=1 Tax=Blautia sp. TaxID=1955243 RepID=UPI002E79CC74|nr:hypothetical protein [Blautia sp.]MEE0809677.1 hypothetical protein [Blautia sp.]